MGEPRPKYIRSNIKGLWNRPTVLNNVETWANIPLIINQGADWFTGFGTEGSKGTKIFALVGKIINTGLVEIPMGMTLREIIFEIGGGISRRRTSCALPRQLPAASSLPSSVAQARTLSGSWLLSLVSSSLRYQPPNAADATGLVFFIQRSMRFRR